MRKAKPQRDFLSSKAKEPSSPAKGSFLIPTSQTSLLKKPDDRPPTNEITSKHSHRPTSLIPISSTFYDLPVSCDHQPVSGHLYISSKATYPTSDELHLKGKAKESEILSSLPVDRRTIFITNLPRSVNEDSLISLFANNLDLSRSSLEVVIHDHQEPNPKVNITSSAELSLIERDLQVTLSAASDPSSLKKSKQGKAKSTLAAQSIPPIFDLKLDDATQRRLFSRRLIPTAHVRFDVPDHVKRLMALDPTRLPLKWPRKSKSDGWMNCYRNRRATCRPSLDQVKKHTDKWMAAWESGRIPPLPQDVELISQELTSVVQEQDEDDGGGWTVVTRGGQHGRSATTTISTQPPSQARGADPYAQSSMAARDANAAVKVMKRNFGKTFANSELDQDDLPSTKKKRIGGELNVGFYRSTSSLKDHKKNRLNEIRNRFHEDKAKIDEMKKVSRKFKPY